MTGSLLADVELRGFRSARRLRLSPSAVCALVGEARAGKSNVLAGIRAAADPAATQVLDRADVPAGDRTLSIRLTLADGSTVTVDGEPGHLTVAGQDACPPVVALPASARATSVVAAPLPVQAADSRATELFTRRLQTALEDAATSPALSMLDTVRACCMDGVRGRLLLVEEPELYLGPQAQRYLYRLLRRFAAGGNQVIYSTHSAAFLNVARLDELAYVERGGDGGSRVVRPGRLEPDEDFRLLSEFDAERAELLLARAALLVEGMTEKLAMPFVFSALGIDADAERVAIVECGGKANLPLFAAVCASAQKPCVVLHDLDARPGRYPSRGEQRLNRQIADAVGAGRAIALAPDFEGVCGLRGHSHKPRQAWSAFAHRPARQIPEPLKAAVRLVTGLARSPDGRTAAPLTA